MNLNNDTFRMVPFWGRIMAVWTAFTIVTVVVVLQISIFISECIKKSKKSNQNKPSNSNKYKVSLCVFGVIGCNYYNTFVSVLAGHSYPNCSICKWSFPSIVVSFVFGRVFNYLFFIQRAKLAQGLTPILPKCAFNICLPIFSVFVGIIFIICLMLFNVNNGICTYYEDTPNQIGCFPTYDTMNIKSFTFIIGSTLEIIFTLIFLYMFGKPLYKILKVQSELASKNNNYSPIKYKVNTSQNASQITSTTASARHSPKLGKFESTSNRWHIPPTNLKSIDTDDNIPNTTRNIAQSISKIINVSTTPLKSGQTEELRKTLLYNVIFSFLNLFSSNFLILCYSLHPTKFYYVPSIDYVLNPISIFMMLGRNRTFCVFIWIKLKIKIVKVYDKLHGLCTKITETVSTNGQNNNNSDSNNRPDGSIEIVEEQIAIENASRALALKQTERMLKLHQSMRDLDKQLQEGSIGPDIDMDLGRTVQ